MVIANESFQGLAAARVVIEAAGGKLCNFDGCDFHLNEYLEGQRIDDHLLAAAPGNFSGPNTNNATTAMRLSSQKPISNI